MEEYAHLPHYSQPGSQSAPWLAMHPGQWWLCVVLGSQNNNFPRAQCHESLWYYSSCVVVKTVAVIKIAKWKCNFEQTEITYCIILQLNTVWYDPVWPQSKPLQRRLHWNIHNTLLLCGTCWENMPRDKLLHTAPPAAAEIELMCCTSSDFQSSENIHGFHQI